MKCRFSRVKSVLFVVVFGCAAAALGIAGAQTSNERVVVVTRSYSPPFHYSRPVRPKPGEGLDIFTEDTVVWYSKAWSQLKGWKPDPHQGSLADMKADAIQHARTSAGQNATRACQQEFANRTAGSSDVPYVMKGENVSFTSDNPLVRQVKLIDYAIDDVVCDRTSREAYLQYLGPRYWEGRPILGLHTEPEDLMCYAAVKVTCEFPAVERYSDNNKIGTSTRGNDSSSYSAPAAPSSSQTKVTLQIQSNQGSVINDQQKVVALYCLTRHLMLTRAQSTMDIEVRVGDQSVTFKENGTKSLQIEATAQNYSISGKMTVTFGARDSRGSESQISGTYTFLGDGTVDLSRLAGSGPITFALTPVSERVITYDASSGEVEKEITLSLRK